jgi:glycosyltransferase involved in cell wall biosynthesis
MTPAEPLVSIITPSYNHAAYIEQTIKSVREQDYPHIEHIVMDGGSTDNTLDILRQYEDRLIWVSEKDSGQTNAINKGFRKATGEIMAWLNSDDVYMPGAVRAMVEHFQQHPEDKFVYGDVLAVDEHEQSYGVRTHVHQGDQQELVNRVNFIVQPATFWRREVWETVGELDESLHYVMDYEYWMRVAGRYALRHIPVVIAKERMYPSAKTFSGAVTRMEEMEAVAKRYGGTGIPYNYRAEAAANYAVRGFKRLGSGEWSGAKADFGRVGSIHPPLLTFLRYFGAMTLLGPESISGLWLRKTQRETQR